MKKYIFVFIAAIFLSILSASAYADSLSVADFNMLEGKSSSILGFEITSGISKDSDYAADRTFDKTRTFSGKAPRDSVIEIIVYAIAEIDDTDIDFDNAQSPMLVERDSYKFTVGPSGMFTQTVDLHIDENYIVVRIVSKDTISVRSTVIKRKDQDIMLERSIILPGQGSKMQVD